MKTERLIANKENQRDDDPVEDKSDKEGEIDLGTLERYLKQNNFNETEQGEKCQGSKETLVLMTPSSFRSPTKKPPATMSL